MKNTTDSQLAEQAYRDYQKTTEATENKIGISFNFNEYARHFGIPLKLEPTSSNRYAKICHVAIKHHSNWLAGQIHNEWKLGGGK